MAEEEGSYGALERHVRAARDGLAGAEDALAGNDGEALEASLAAARHELQQAESSLPRTRHEDVDTLVELDRTAERARPVDPAVVESLRELTLAWAREYATSRPPQLLELVRAHVDRTAAGLDRPLPPSVRTHLAAVASETASLAGWILHSAGRPGEAQAHFVLAATVARDVGDRTRHALALGSLAGLFSTLTRGTAGGSPPALRLLHRAGDLVGPDAPPVARSWLAARLAEEHAALGDAPGFGAAAARARAAAQDPVRAESGVYSTDGVLSMWGPGRPGLALSEQLGAGLLGDQRAMGGLDALLGTVAAPVDRTLVLGDAATVALAHRQHDRAADRAADLFDLAVDHGLFGRLDRVRGLRARLPDRAPGVVALDERLRGRLTG